LFYFKAILTSYSLTLVRLKIIELSLINIYNHKKNIKIFKYCDSIDIMEEHDLVKKQAKEIMDNFMIALKDIGVKSDFKIIQPTCFRDESDKPKTIEEYILFRESFLANAPKTAGNAILTKKGDWL